MQLTQQVCLFHQFLKRSASISICFCVDCTYAILSAAKPLQCVRLRMTFDMKVRCRGEAVEHVEITLHLYHCNWVILDRCNNTEHTIWLLILLLMKESCVPNWRLFFSKKGAGWKKAFSNFAGRCSLVIFYRPPALNRADGGVQYIFFCFDTVRALVCICRTHTAIRLWTMFF
jgi:hypothetical protein